MTTIPKFRRFQIYQYTQNFRYVILTNYHPTFEQAVAFACDLGLKFPDFFSDLIITEQQSCAASMGIDTAFALALETIVRGQRF